MSERMQGIVRYGREIIKALDEIVDTGAVILATPSDAYEIPCLEHIKVVTVGKRRGILWEQLDLAAFMHQNPDMTLVNLCNIKPLLAPSGITVVHDVMYRANPQDYTTARNRLSRFWHMLQYSRISKNERAVITVSEFSKGEIERYYPKARGKIRIVPSAWQHVLEYEESSDWQERYPFLVPGDFYFSLATLSRNKNGKWIIEVAKRNPNAVFAVAGKKYETEYQDVPSNVSLLGYISDEDACSLMKNCRAFIFPSLCEGFGLPPLEALALGAKVIASNTSSLPEVLGNAAHYIDPDNYNINIERLAVQSAGEPSLALDKYSWQKSARSLLEIMKVNKN